MATLLDVGYEMPVALQMKAAEEMEGSSRAWRNALSAVWVTMRLLQISSHVKLLTLYQTSKS